MERGFSRGGLDCLGGGPPRVTAEPWELRESRSLKPATTRVRPAVIELHGHRSLSLSYLRTLIGEVSMCGV